jgi:hypothetical protein
MNTDYLLIANKTLMAFVGALQEANELQAKRDAQEAERAYRETKNTAMEQIIEMLQRQQQWNAHLLERFSHLLERVEDLEQARSAANEPADEPAAEPAAEPAREPACEPARSESGLDISPEVASLRDSFVEILQNAAQVLKERNVSEAKARDWLVHGRWHRAQRSVRLRETRDLLTNALSRFAHVPNAGRAYGLAINLIDARWSSVWGSAH